MDENIDEKIKLLTPQELIEVDIFISYLIFKRKSKYLLESSKMLEMLSKHGIHSWKALAKEIMDSGIVRGKVGGYMKRKHVNDWLCEKFSIDQDVAEQLILTLIKKHMIDYSSYGNLG